MVKSNNEALYNSSLDDLLNILDKNWEEGGSQYEQEKQQYRKDAEEMLRNYWYYINDNSFFKFFVCINYG